MITAKRIARYLSYALFFLLWLGLMLVPCFAFALAARGEVEWRRGEHVSDRIWLIQEKRQKGIGYQAERIFSDDADVDGLVCARTTVRFFLWEGTAEGAEYCECFSNDGTPASVTCPP
jgi:hypothetical protein